MYRARRAMLLHPALLHPALLQPAQQHAAQQHPSTLIRRRLAAGLLLACALAIGGLQPAPAQAGSVTRISDVGAAPVSTEVHQTLPLKADGTVQIDGIGGNVSVRGGDAAEVALHYRRRAATQRDLDCERLQWEQTASGLRIWTQSAQPECHMIRADDELDLVVPRTASVSMDAVGDSVQVSDVGGMVRLNAVGDSAELDGVSQLRVGAIGDTLSVRVGKLAPAGIRIDSVGDEVELHLPRGTGARLRIDSVGGEVRGIDGGDDDRHGGYDVAIAGGGPEIHISSVGDDVVVEH